MPGGPMRWDELQPGFARIGERLDSIEAQLVIVSEKLGVPFSPINSGVPAEVVELARAGKTIEAITKYRELTNASAPDARAVVMAL